MLAHRNENNKNSSKISHFLVRYAKYYELPEPLDDIDEVMEHAARKLHALAKGKSAAHGPVWLGK